VQVKHFIDGAEVVLDRNSKVSSESSIEGLRGNSLLAVLVSLAVFSMLASVIAQQMRHQYQIAGLLRQKANEEQLRVYLRMRVDCQSTWSVIGDRCQSEEAQLMGLGGVLIGVTGNGQNPFTEVGPYLLRATCHESKVREYRGYKRWVAIAVRHKIVDKEFRPLFPDLAICEKPNAQDPATRGERNDG
jgi:type II secretory pathway pseudopilin PulG